MAWAKVDGEWDWVEPIASEPEVFITDNPVVAELLGPDGRVIRQMQEREPFGFRVR